MKNYEEMTNSLLERRDRYVAEQKRKRKKLISAVSSACCLCLVAVLGVAVWHGTKPPSILDDTVSIGGKDWIGPNDPSGGAANSSDNDLNNPNPNTGSEASDYIFTSFNADYPLYKNAAEIVKASANIYTATVKDITFEIIDMKTGEIDDSSESQSTSRMLYTVYTVSLISSVKGDNLAEIKICSIGGMVGYREAEQYGKMQSSGLLNSYNGIPVVAESNKLDIGNEYLFCTNRVENHDFCINPTQFAHPIDSDNADLIISASN